MNELNRTTKPNFASKVSVLFHTGSQLVIMIFFILLITFSWRGIVLPLIGGNMVWGSWIFQSADPEDEDTVVKSNEGWVYIGTSRDKETFDTGDKALNYNLPQGKKIISIDDITGKTIQNTIAINLREEKPRYIAGNWQKGEKKGYIRSMSEIEVLTITYAIPATGGGIRVWAIVKVDDDDIQK